MSALLECRRLLLSFRSVEKAAAGTRLFLSTKASKPGDAAVVSSCPANTIINGVNYLKGQPPVLALPDEEYPQWLWGLLNNKTVAEDGPGGRAEKAQLRAENRRRIKDQNFLRTQ
ncbi:mitochondrial/chloroplast ribosomal protein L54/L37 [Sistotremastrum niveocremeum HHB9708]|uniref:Large ribosomal subunit protein mL54 n=1 Tax=Sistotremastrum niveocremeum HHB9708 TaxID=1314777 RepID=A0A165AJA0_9AGAM|nr:mitochondrial/chloroplast ribosomal protein L54/L37 [Sistotremastrum niveocremeum HHB9708]